MRRDAMSTLVTTRNGIQTKLLWAGIVALGAVSFGIVALNRGETVNAAWLVIAALCIYFIAYRFYALFIADKVLGVDPTPPAPVPSSARYWLSRWGICPARCGSLRASSSPARFKT